MILFSRMWFSEVERLGSIKCSPLSYTLRNIGDMMSFVALALIIGAIFFTLSWWYVFFAWLFGRVLCVIANTLLTNRNFTYDYESDKSQWLDKQGNEHFFDTDMYHKENSK